jgi:hypothetical protein
MFYLKEIKDNIKIFKLMALAQKLKKKIAA